MARRKQKQLLSEGEMRRFMKLANISPINEMDHAGKRDEDEEKMEEEYHAGKRDEDEEKMEDLDGED